MPKISYQEIVTADVSESGTILHEWDYRPELQIPALYHLIDGVCVDKFVGGGANKIWSQLCRSK